MIVSIGVEKAFDKTLHSFMITVFNTPRIEGNFLNLIKVIFQKSTAGTSLVVQWLRLHTPNAGSQV